jgi:GNAT superfamily N-acetyltransferase
MDEARISLYQQLADVEMIEANGGRILASIHPRMHPVGALAVPEGDPAVIAAGEDWLRARGCTCVQGPMEVCTWFNYRANTGPMDRPPFLFEPDAEAEPWISRGYSVVSEYLSTLADNERQILSADVHRARALSEGFTLRPLKFDQLEAELDLIHQLSLRGFQGAFSYVDLPQEVFRSIYLPYRAQLDPRLVLIAEGKRGDPVGFCFSIPDLLNPDRKEFIVKTLAVVPEARMFGLGSWILAECHMVAQDAGYTGGGIHALMWSGSASRRMTKHGGRAFRSYALYEKSLTPPQAETPA